MSAVTASEDIVGRLAAQSDTLGRLAKDEGAFASVFAAFDSRDPAAFRWVLERQDLLPHCEVICEWVRVKLGVLRCAELCGGPQAEGDLPDVRAFAHAITRLAAQEAPLRRLIDAVGCGDAEAYRAVVAELELERYCPLICRWIYSVIYERVCEAVCTPTRVFLPDPAADVRAAARVLARVADKERLFDAIGRAAVSLDDEPLRAVLGENGVLEDCQIFCRLVCVWRGAWVCRALCERPSPILRGVHAVEEARAFALAAGALASQPRALGDLTGAVETRNPKAFEAVVGRFGLEPYCEQVCAWVSHLVCAEFCYRVCRPLALNPWFTTVGYFDIVSDIDPATGLTNKGLSDPGLYYGGGPNFAFYGPLQLGGFCPSFSPTSPGVAMQYRFQYDAGAGPQPITYQVAQVLLGTRLIEWPINVGGVASAATAPTFQSVTLIAAPAPADPVPPAAGAAWYGPTTAYVSPDPVEGWIVVDPNAVGGGFQTLLGFNSLDVVAGGAPAPGVPAGTAVPAAAQRTGSDLAITFEATRVGVATVDYSNTLSRIHINNWSEVNEIYFPQFQSPTGCCTPITDTLGVQATFDHEQMAAGAWSLGFSSCSNSAPPVIGLSTSLAAAITASQTTITVSAGATPPTPFNATIAAGETVTVTAVAGPTWTVTRGAAPAAAAAGAVVWAASPTLAFTGRGGAGTIEEDTSAWLLCSYSATLTTRPGLTTGMIDYQGTPNLLTFCICGH
jgi:hypothetical protein